MRAKFINEASKYWDHTSRFHEEYQDLWNELVPAQGEAPTLQGELLRNMSRIAYDYYNNGFGNDKKDEALFLEGHSNLFKPYMTDPKNWDKFFNEYEEIHFGDYDEMWKEAEEEAREAERYGGNRYSSYEEDEDEEEDYEEDPEDYFTDVDTRMKMTGWEKVIDSQIDDIMDGIIKYIRLTQDKLEPLQTTA